MKESLSFKEHYNLETGDIVSGIIVSAEEEVIIGLVKEVENTPDSFESGCTIEGKFINYTCVESENFSIDDLREVDAYEDVITDLESLDASGEIILCSQLFCLNVFNSY